MVLRPILDEDLDLLFEHQRDPAAVAMSGVPPRERAAFDAHWREIRREPSIVVRAVVVDGALAGHVTCFPREGERRLGYWLGREHWGRGIATAAVRAFLAEVPERPLWATVEPANAASQAVLVRTGFRPAGTRDGLARFCLDG